jgi:hypothetical protein
MLVYRVTVLKAVDDTNYIVIRNLLTFVFRINLPCPIDWAW